MSRQNWKPGNMVYPLPAVMVSCQRPGEKPNIITVAWCGTVCTNPAMVSISVRPERYSYDILKETGEFVINLTTGPLTRAADYCGVRSGRNVDKFAEMHLTELPSQKVSCPGIAESPVNIECRVTQILKLGSHHMFLAEVVNVSVDDSLLNEKGSLTLDRADLTAYSHGTYYHLGEAIGTFGYSVRKMEKTGKKQSPEQRASQAKNGEREAARKLSRPEDKESGSERKFSRAKDKKNGSERKFLQAKDKKTERKRSAADRKKGRSKGNKEL